MKAEEPRYRIEMTQSQLALIARCIEDVSRFMTGQMELFNSTVLLEHNREVQELLKMCYPCVVPELYKEYGGYGASHGWNGSSCPNDAQRKFIAQTYYIYREIYHQLEITREPKSYYWSVYRGETLRCEDSGEPIKIEKI
jgi:hypothetical protein